MVLNIFISPFSPRLLLSLSHTYTRHLSHFLYLSALYFSFALILCISLSPSLPLCLPIFLYLSHYLSLSPFLSLFYLSLSLSFFLPFCLVKSLSLSSVFNSYYVSDVSDFVAALHAYDVVDSVNVEALDVVLLMPMVFMWLPMLKYIFKC